MLWCYTFSSVKWHKVFKSRLSKFCGRQPLKELLGPLLNTMSQMIQQVINKLQEIYPLKLIINRTNLSFMKSLVIDTVPKLQRHNTEIKLKSSVLKSLHAKWVVKPHNTLTSIKDADIINNCWKSTNTSQTVTKVSLVSGRSTSLFSVDPLISSCDQAYSPSLFIWRR